MVELADTRDLGSRGEIRAGSNPVVPTIFPCLLARGGLRIIDSCFAAN